MDEGKEGKEQERSVRCLTGLDELLIWWLSDEESEERAASIIEIGNKAVYRRDPFVEKLSESGAEVAVGVVD